MKMEIYIYTHILIHIKWGHIYTYFAHLLNIALVILGKTLIIFLSNYIFIYIHMPLIYQMFLLFWSFVFEIHKSFHHAIFYFMDFHLLLVNQIFLFIIKCKYRCTKTKNTDPFKKVLYKLLNKSTKANRLFFDIRNTK